MKKIKKDGVREQHFSCVVVLLLLDLDHYILLSAENLHEQYLNRVNRRVTLMFAPVNSFGLETKMNFAPQIKLFLLRRYR